MKSVVIGAHLFREDVEPLAEAIPVSDLFVSAVRVADDRPLGDRDLLLEVANVRGRLLERATFIAIRYGFAARDPAEVANKCAVRAPRWRELLRAHREEVEMTLKVAAASRRPDRHEFTSGAEYLKALHATATIDPLFRAGVEKTIGPLATQNRWVHGELAMLVRRKDLDSVQAAGEQLRRDFAGVPFLLSGPWPLEVFADDDR